MDRSDYIDDTIYFSPSVAIYWFSADGRDGARDPGHRRPAPRPADGTAGRLPAEPPRISYAGKGIHSEAPSSLRSGG